ncbi:MAG TPA: hypothetical protein DCK98_02805 [Chloroflexi bacterium]|jgi:hypothetical protein|nr:hypothetical protein [Chloroflexota bacterium]
MSIESEGVMLNNETLVLRGSERRGDGRRSDAERRFAERRDPVRATAGRRVQFPFDRRIAERRALERRESWPEPGL